MSSLKTTWAIFQELHGNGRTLSYLLQGFYQLVGNHSCSLPSFPQNKSLYFLKLGHFWQTWLWPHHWGFCAESFTGCSLDLNSWGKMRYLQVPLVGWLSTNSCKATQHPAPQCNPALWLCSLEGGTALAATSGREKLSGTKLSPWGLSQNAYQYQEVTAVQITLVHMKITLLQEGSYSLG